MKRISLYIIIILILISGCRTLHNWIIKPIDDLSVIYVFNALFVDEMAKNITCYYYQQNKFPSTHMDILPLFSNESIDNLRSGDFTFLRMDSTFTGIAKYNFEVKNYSISTFTDDTTDSSIDSIRIYKSIGNIAFVDSITHKDERAFIIEILTTCIVGSVYWNNDSTYIDQNNCNQSVDTSEYKNIVKDTIQISRSCPKGYGFDFKSEQP